MSVPAVSVVLPTHDRAGSVVAAVESVLGGTHGDLELIVVDDASSDDTADRLSQIDDARLRVVRLEQNVGGAEARNVGIRHSRADWVAFQDSDDLWTPDHLEQLLDALPDTDTAAAFGQARYPSGRSTPEADWVEDLFATLLRFNVIPLPASVVRRRALLDVGGFHAPLPRLQDWDLFLSLSRSYRVVHVPVPILDVGEDGPRISTNLEAYYRALDLILRRHEDLFRRDPMVLAAHRMQLVRHHVTGGRLGRAGTDAVRLFTHPSGLAGWLRARVLSGRSPISRVKT